ncbi:hypothetical protein [Mycobacterium persicum]|uniref:hypothetical protein n=1 Tax=Mycobacterium persicum TaxID=1487726 RepID=UPI001C614095|nr:hypothetical protein [Mycobacterium persicum]
MPQITASAKSRVIGIGGPPAVSAGRSTIIAGSDPTRAFGLFHRAVAAKPTLSPRDRAGFGGT